MWSLLIALTSAHATLLSANHSLDQADGQLVWTTHLLRAEAGAERLELLRPLPRGVDVEGATPILDDQGQVVALELEAEASRHRSLRVRQPLAGLEAKEEELLLPRLATSEPQRVDLGALAFDPRPESGLMVHLTGLTHPEVSRRDRRRLDRQMGESLPAPGRSVLYLGPRRSEPLRGDLYPTSAPASAQTALTAAVGFGALVLGLLASLSLLKRLRRAEEIERYVQQEFVASRSEEGGVKASP
jgi:hypothetical protein